MKKDLEDKQIEKIEKGTGLDTYEGAWQWISHGPLGWDPEHIELNQGNFIFAMKSLLSENTQVHIIKDKHLKIDYSDGISTWDLDTITIETETGILLDATDNDITTKKDVKLKKCFMDDLKIIQPFVEHNIIFNGTQTRSVTGNNKHVYIRSIENVQNGIIIYGFSYTKGKKRTVTFTIDDNLYHNFSIITDNLAINKSKFIENKIREFVNALDALDDKSPV